MDETSVITIPLEIVELEDNSYHIIVPVEINGIKGDIIIDTGASVTVIDKQLVSGEEETESISELQSGSVTGQIDNIQVIHARSFIIGEQSLENIRMAIIDLDYVNQMYNNHLNRKIIGLLGCDFCVKYKVVIDYQNEVFTLKLS